MEDTIQKFYEQYPYPAPRSEIEDIFLNQGHVQEACPSCYFHMYWPDRQYTQELDILIAGCGTSQAPTSAIANKNARITAIDVSERSLESSRQLAKTHGIKNIEHILCPIEEVHTLGKKFDLISCTGVLHHLKDHSKALRALRSALKPEGSMFLMLYAKYGRAGLYMIQELFNKMGITHENVSEYGMEEVMKFVRELPPSHTFQRGMYRSGTDLESIYGSADMFLNPRDVAYTVPDVYNLLRDSGMVMQRWYQQYDYSPRCMGLGRGKFAAKIQQLPIEEQYALGELYRGCIIKHKFICCSNEREKATYAIDLEKDWENLIPIRSPFVLRSSADKQEGRSDWIWMWHYEPYGDRMNFNAQQTLIFDAIDMRKTIAELQKIAGVSDSFIKGFMRTLQDCDLVWFRK